METSLQKIKKSLILDAVDAILISSVPQIAHLTGYTNFSIQEREAYILITLNEQYIFTDGRYSEAIRGSVKEFELLEITSEARIADHLKNLSKKHKIKNLGVEENNLTVSEHKKFSEVIKSIKGVQLHDIRAVKEDWEIKNIEYACSLGDRAFEYILKKIKPGMSEEEVALEMEMFIRKNGAVLSFDTIVGFGKNSSVPHHHTGRAKLDDKAGQFILLDFGCKWNFYCSDMTRTIFWGKPSQKQIKIYQTVYDAQQKAVEYIQKVLNPAHYMSEARPNGRQVQDDNLGVNASEVDKVARDYILSKGFPSIPHGLGHGVGIEVHEHPRLGPNSKDILSEGMVFSVEPGIYIPGFGGVRIEDLFVIEGKNLKKLTGANKNLITL